MYILDTDHMSLLQRDDSPEGNRLRQRLHSIPEEQISTSIVSFEEQVRGWLAAISMARRASEVILAYQRLLQLLYNYRNVTVRDFADTAADQFEILRQKRIRIGTNDLRIASITLARNETLLTRNTRDFSKVPGLRFEDWTR